MKGIFISVEGIEGTGKTTLAGFLAEYLQGKGLRVTQTEEPGGTSIGRKIRELLLSPENGEMDPVTELLLYNASRVQHIREIIMPALERGDVVITDRFSDSTMAYQGYGRGIDVKLIDSLDLISTQRLRPDITILLDIDVQTGLRRNREINKDDRIEREDVAFHGRVRNGFIHIAAQSPERIRMVDCSVPVETVRQNVAAIIDEFLEEWKAGRNQ
ncbi:MAG: dTMP kinase [Candidatus Sulfobium sp.]